MAESQEQLVDVRQLWEHEALNFTPWLAENLESLGDAIGLKLELVQQERLIGSMYLDILARESRTDTLVAIENQLEWTDTDHLGRLLIYAAGSGAKVAILVAPEFMFEHAQVLHQLNEWTRSNARFYGVKVEVRRTDDALLVPRFRKVVYPGGWDKSITLTWPLPPRPEVQQHQDFFQPIIEKLASDSGLLSVRQRFDYRDRLFPFSVNPAVGYAVSFWKSEAWVYLHIDTNDSTEGLFHELQADREEIESEFQVFPKQEWWWARSRTFATIGIRKTGSIDDPPDELEATASGCSILFPNSRTFSRGGLRAF